MASETSDSSPTETDDIESEIYSTTQTDVSFVEGEEDEDQEHDNFVESIRHSKGRHLKAEVVEWAVCPVDYLLDLSIKFIADHFIEIGVKRVQNAVNSEQWQAIMDNLSLDLPEELLLPTLDDSSYWKRRGESLWDIWDLYGGNWRKLYAERRMAEFIESFVPNASDPRILDKAVKMSRDLVTCLHIKQLQLNIEKEEESYVRQKNESESESEEEEEIESPRPYAPPSHLDVGKVLLRFPKLDEVKLCVAPTNCGLNYDYLNFELTENDGQLLMESFSKMPNLKALHLYGSHVSYSLVNDLSKTFINHSALKTMDLSYNLLNSENCKPICQLLMGPCPLETLILCYNAIGSKGVMYIAAALTENRTLKRLDLKLNGICDEGGEFLVRCCQRNNTLEELDISGNKLGANTGLAFADFIGESKSMKILNLSSNGLGIEAGEKLKGAMEKNTTLQMFDVRLCDFSEEDEIAIRDFVFRNTNGDLSLV